MVLVAEKRKIKQKLDKNETFIFSEKIFVQ